MNCSLPGSSVHGIPQASMLEWVAIPFSRRSSQVRYRTQVSCIAGRIFTIWANRESFPWRKTFKWPVNPLKKKKKLLLFKSQILLKYHFHASTQINVFVYSISDADLKQAPEHLSSHQLIPWFSFTALTSWLKISALLYWFWFTLVS